MMTEEQLGRVMPKARNLGRLARWYPPLSRAMADYAISTDMRQCMFIANIAAETDELDAKVENLNYKPERLCALFPTMFAKDRQLADRLVALGPVAIANYIYADENRLPRSRLGNCHPGDGWRYRGRGPMQLTGRANYERFFASIGIPADSDPDRLLDPDIGARSAAGSLPS